MTKHIFVTGGVVSGLGKGITAASLGRLLKARGVRVAAQKLDPYINMDPGTMSPLQHGEVFVTEDGAETDLDLGHYERFMDENLTRFSNLTTGKVYWNVLQKERRGEYLGQTIQVIPHITDEIKAFIYAGAKESNAEILITEIGGTIGDIESQPFLEAIRQIMLEKGRESCLALHVTLVPYIPGSEELKSKPTQHSVKELQSAGIAPGVIVTRCDIKLPETLKAKIAMFCNVEKDCVIENTTLKNLYEAPLMLHKNGLDKIVCQKLGVKSAKPDLTEWILLTRRIQERTRKVNIALVGKYTELHDAYLSVTESLNHAGFAHGADVRINYVDSALIDENNAGSLLKGADGIIIPGGFGNRGTAGMAKACGHARKNNIPCLGICLGMQIMAIEFAREECGLVGANSTEFDANTPHPVIDLMERQRGISDKGGTMRLGAYPCSIADDTLLNSLYRDGATAERHRHRYEFNNLYRDAFKNHGMAFCGVSPDGALVEAMELARHPYYMGVQFHPEFKSRPNRPHPVFAGFIDAALKNRG